MTNNLVEASGWKQLSFNTGVFVLVDGHALAFRHFFALPIQNFTTRRGEPTNATYGFTRNIMDILKSSPEYVAVVFDRGLSGRDKVYPHYKGNRPRGGDSLSLQLDRIRELLYTFKIPVVERPGIEGDDVIGSVARKIARHGTHVRIVTCDHDLIQLVTHDIQVELPKGIYTLEKARQEYGLEPRQIPDLKGLMGDKTDNIPGVKGIGAKTATRLLQEYDTLENLYDHVDKLTPHTRKLLTSNREQAFMSKCLGQIKNNLRFTVKLEQCVPNHWKYEEVRRLLSQLEFRTLLPKLPQLAATLQTA